MAYRSTEKTRQKKDAKRTRMMQATMQVFAEKGYHAATIRDIVAAADVAIGTFYFYFPDKETLFIHLFDETAEFLLQAIRQAVRGKVGFDQQIQAGLQSYVNIAAYEPAVVQLLLVGGAAATGALTESRAAYREKLTQIWQRPVEEALDAGTIPPQNGRRTAEALAGAFDEVILNLLAYPDLEVEAAATVEDLTLFALRAAAFTGQ